MAFVTLFLLSVQLKHLQIQYFTLSSLNFHIQWDAQHTLVNFPDALFTFFQRGSTIFSSLTLNIKNRQKIKII